MSAISRAEVCIVACAEAFRGDGEILASGIGVIPSLGVRLARRTFEPDLLATDGVATLIRGEGQQQRVEGWMPYRKIFDTLWWGRRHVMMGASQIDRFGNQNIAWIGKEATPEIQLLGFRGSPGNTINHCTSYWIPNHNPRVFVPTVDVVCGVGYDRAGGLDKQSSRFHEIRRVVTNLGVFNFDSSDHRMRLVSLHPGVPPQRVLESTGFELLITGTPRETRLPTEDELQIIREQLDPERSYDAGVKL